MGMVKLGMLKGWVFSNLGMLIFGYTRGWVYSNLGTLKGWVYSVGVSSVEVHSVGVYSNLGMLGEGMLGGDTLGGWAEECEELRHNISVKYEDFFGDIDSQISATKLYSKVMSARKKMFQQLDQ